MYVYSVLCTCLMYSNCFDLLSTLYFRIPSIVRRKVIVTRTGIIKTARIDHEILRTAIHRDRTHQNAIIVLGIEHIAIKLGIYKNYMKKKEIDRIEMIRDVIDRIIKKNTILPVIKF